MKETNKRALLATAWLFVALGMLLSPWSVFRSPIAASRYFGGDAAELVTWSWPAGSWSWDEAPFKYRVIFHGAVDLFAGSLATAASRPIAYWLALVCVAAASICFAGVALDALLKALGYTSCQRVAGQVAWFALPPVHLAFAYPVQTKEDFVAYGIFFLGLAALLKRKWVLVLCLSVFGALTRETLLLLPLLYAVASAQSPLRRFGPLVAALATHAALRLALGQGGYDAFKLDENLSSPLVAATSVAMVLGYGWLRLERSGELGKLLLVALPLVLSTHIVFGRIQEIRISLLLAPWAVVAIAGAFPMRIPWRRLCWCAGGVFLFEASGLAGLVRAISSHHIDSFANRVWWVELYAQVILTVAWAGARRTFAPSLISGAPSA